jgi:hypothetical protein
MEAAMRRLTVVGALAALSIAAIAMPAPEAVPDPLSGVVVDRPGIESPADSAIWYCPWAQATSERDSLVSIATMAPAGADFTFPVSIPGEAPDRATASTAGPGAGIVRLSDIAQRGDSPAFIEFSGGPSAAAVTVTGDMLSADTCVARGGNEWFFVGGSTMIGDQLRLRLFNPFPESAQVSIGAFSEIGAEALGDLRRVTVNGRSWRDVDFTEALRQRQSLVVSVTLVSGLLIPAMSFQQGDDAAWWSGTGLSTEWEIPIVRIDGEDDAVIVVANPGLSEAAVSVELYGTRSSDREVIDLDLAAESPARIDLSEVGFAVVGARLAATSPVAAGVASTGPSGTAVTAALPERGRVWLVPGASSRGGNLASLWLLNTGEEAIVVTVSQITADDTFNSSEILPPGTVTRLPVVGPAALGYLIRSAEPFTVAWTLVGESGMAYSSGLMVPEND